MVVRYETLLKWSASNKIEEERRERRGGINQRAAGTRAIINKISNKTVPYDVR